VEELKYIPISALAELAYCPRNFYYRMVEGVEDENIYILKGKLQDISRKERKRVWRKSGIQTRYVKVSSEKLQLIGIIDAIKEGDEICPIEYKTGKIKESLSDNIQLCAEAMVLEEKYNRPINKGYIYYSQSKEKREVNFDDSLRNNALSLISYGFDILNGNSIPEPFNDKRCNGCSLQSLCLPQETSYLKGKASKPKRAVPSLRLNRVLYVDEQGAYIRKSMEKIVVAKEGKKLLEIPIVNLDEIVLVGNVNYSSQLLKLLLKKNIRVSYITTYGHYEGSFQPELSKNSKLRILQFRKFIDDKFKLDISKRFVKGKISNMRTLLLRYNQTLFDEDINKVTVSLKKNLEELEEVKTSNEILGLEGISTRNYFSAFNKIFKTTYEFNFEKRKRRPPTDPINSLLSLGYTLLLKDMIGALYIAGLDPYIGYFHVAKYGRPSLALDLMEEFRPIIADSVALTLINKEILKPDDFKYKLDGCYLKENARSKFYNQYEQRKRERIKHPIFRYILPYFRIFELQARFLAKVLTGEIDEYIPFMVR